MPAQFSNDVFRVPLRGGSDARIRVQRYRDGIVWLSAAPDPGDKDETASLAAIAILKEEIERFAYEPRIVYRRLRPDGPGGRIVDLPDAVCLRTRRSTQELLELVQRTASLTVH